MSNLTVFIFLHAIWPIKETRLWKHLSAILYLVYGTYSVHSFLILSCSLCQCSPLESTKVIMLKGHWNVIDEKSTK